MIITEKLLLTLLTLPSKHSKTLVKALAMELLPLENVLAMAWLAIMGERLGDGMAIMGERLGDGMATVGERLGDGMATMGDNMVDIGVRLGDKMAIVGENASEYVLDTFADLKCNATEFFFENIGDIQVKRTIIVFVSNTYKNIFIVVSWFMHKYNINITLLMTVFVMCMIITIQMNKLRAEFNTRIEEMCAFIDENEFRHLNIIDESRTEFKKLMTAQTGRITNGLKKLRQDQIRHSKRVDMTMYERIRNHRHKELLERICMYLDLFNQYATGDKFNTLFNISDDITYLNPAEEGAIIKKYFIKYLVWNNTAKCQILYPLNLAHAPNVYSETIRNIRNYADTLPANSVKDLTQFREEVETNYSELFSFPVVRSPKETQVDFEISVFERLDECLGASYKIYNMYCSAGLQ